MEQTKKLALGILAHVDAGKTTLAEGILYQTGQIRKAGRVDHKDAFLDNEELHIGTRPHYTSICRPRLHRFMITAWRSLSIGRKKHSLPIFAKCDAGTIPRSKTCAASSDYLAGGPLEYMAAIFRKLALEFYL